ncbi:putative AMP deaminase [Helianthus annuus]|uniref:AMP deaminase-like isoform X2 n=1 Tax=Helianthus annuus TaxID=4232 RepID=UPI000B90017C|nr:AMP deaminase-like isoform X2 [Helianthus annuus]KAJ0538333.1 putative AMP deaminase [Helianthus annuus]KAJ0718643.1 putative AMP deaminase [Helianthus annuus]KAJ0721886.1 putative AMP deaminase [Helianthus annuus]
MFSGEFFRSGYNSLFLDSHRNPFPMIFHRGIFVSLSTDDPLQIYLTKEPLVEEYGVAAKFTSLDSHTQQRHIGLEPSTTSDDIQKSNVPKLRIAFRHQTWTEEIHYVYAGRSRLPQEVEY